MKNPKVIKIISKTVQKEIEVVAKRLNINDQKPKKTLKGIRVNSLNLTKREVLEEYKQFVFDEEDSHVVAGTNKVKAKFLLTHNLKHYRVDNIKAQFGILVIKPGNFLQYLRSQGKF